MQNIKSFNSGLFQKNIGANQPIVAATIYLGNTRGRGSKTRILNWCHEHSDDPYSCLEKISGSTTTTTTTPEQNNNIDMNYLTQLVTSMVDNYMGQYLQNANNQINTSLLEALNILNSKQQLALDNINAQQQAAMISVNSQIQLVLDEINLASYNAIASINLNSSEITSIKQELLVKIDYIFEMFFRADSKTIIDHYPL
jgi:hypothetical protein